MATLVEKLMIVISKVTAPEEGGGACGVGELLISNKNINKFCL